MDLKEIFMKQGMTEEQASVAAKAIANANVHVVEDNPEKMQKELREENERLKALEQQNQTLKLQYAVAQGLAKAGVKDPDYLMYQYERQELAGKLQVDEKGRVTGVGEVVKVLQDGFQDYFVALSKETPAVPDPEASSADSKLKHGADALNPVPKQLLEKKLETGEQDMEPETLAEAITQHYAQQEDKD